MRHSTTGDVSNFLDFYRMRYIAVGRGANGPSKFPGWFGDEERGLLFRGWIRRMLRHRYASTRLSSASTSLSIHEGLQCYSPRVGLSKSHVEQILKNPFYTGVFRWNETLYKEKHPALISGKLLNKSHS